jgi:hypothetical protein
MATSADDRLLRDAHIVADHNIGQVEQPRALSDPDAVSYPKLPRPVNSNVVPNANISSDIRTEHPEK